MPLGDDGGPRLGGAVQVPSERFYVSASYCNPSRFASYSYQIAEVLRVTPEEVLEVGPGNGVVSHVLQRAGLRVTTMDIDSRLRPRVVASVLNVPMANSSYDLVLCCEVLEHLPYPRFHAALAELYRVSRRYCLLSLPDAGRFYRVLVHLPVVGSHRFAVALPRLRPRAHHFNGQHYWEIGKAGYSLQQVVHDIRKTGFEILSTYRIWETPSHRVFMLLKP